MYSFFKKLPLAAAANLALILAAIAVVADRIVDLYPRLHTPTTLPPTKRSPTRSRTPFRPGVRAPELKGVDYSHSDRTLVLFLSTNCKFCKSGAPFYKDLAEQVSKTKGSRKVVAAFPQPTEEIMTSKDFRGLGCDIVGLAPFEAMGVTGTPTILLVARDGTVVNTWVGAPSEVTRQIITRAIIS